MGEFGLVLRVLLATVFAISGIAKILHLDRSRQATRDLGMPESLASTVGTLLPVVEVVIAGLLLPQPTGRLGAGLAFGLLLAFSLVVGANLAQGRRPPCNCFGAMSGAPIGPATLVRNGVLLAAAATAWTVGGTADPANLPKGLSPAEWTIGALLALLGAAAIGQGWMILQLLRQHGRLLLRIDRLEAAVGGPVVDALSAPVDQGLPVGAVAPEFSLTGLHGETMTLAALRSAGKPVLLVFSEANCGPCSALMPDLAGWQRDHGSNLTVALVTAGAHDMNRAKAAEHGLVNVLLQDDTEVAELYRYAGTPGAVLIDVRGHIAAPLVSGGPAITAMVERIVAGVPVVLGRRDELDEHFHNHHHEPTTVDSLAVGSPAPAIALPALGGGDGALSEFAGHRVAVLFWNPRCGFCRDLLPRVLAWERDRGADHAELLVVTTGDEADNAAEGFTSTVLLDASGKTMSAYRAAGTPIAVLVDADGNVATTLGVGADGVMALLSDMTTSKGAQK